MHLASKSAVSIMATLCSRGTWYVDVLITQHRHNCSLNPLLVKRSIHNHGRQHNRCRGTEQHRRNTGRNLTRPSRLALLRNIKALLTHWTPSITLTEVVAKEQAQVQTVSNVVWVRNNHFEWLALQRFASGQSHERRRHCSWLLLDKLATAQLTSPRSIRALLSNKMPNFDRTTGAHIFVARREPSLSLSIVETTKLSSHRAAWCPR